MNGTVFCGGPKRIRSWTSLHTDASLVSWAGVIVAAPEGVPREMLGDTFLPRDAHRRHIHVKEAIALRNALTILALAIGDGALYDNTGVVAAFNHDGSRDPLLNDPLKDYFRSPSPVWGFPYGGMGLDQSERGRRAHTLELVARMLSTGRLGILSR